MSLISDLTQLKADLHSIPTDLGLPQYRQIVIRKVLLPDGEIIPQFKDFLLSQKVHVVNIPTRFVGLELTRNSIVISEDDLFCKNLPRLYSKTFLEQDIEFYVVDPVFNESGQVIDGIRCQLLDVRDNRTLSWQLMLRKDPDNSQIEPVEIQIISGAETNGSFIN